MSCVAGLCRQRSARQATAPRRLWRLPKIVQFGRRQGVRNCVRKQGAFRKLTTDRVQEEKNWQRVASERIGERYGGSGQS